MRESELFMAGKLFALLTESDGWRQRLESVEIRHGQITVQDLEGRRFAVTVYELVKQ